jgi:micrococcal nuclease
VRVGRWAVVVGAIGAGVGACGGSARPAATTPAALAPNATLEHVVDGDTVDVEVGGRRERVRLIGIDTPETKKPNTPIQCYGPQASAYTESLLPVGTALHLERDVQARDDYGRLLAYIYRLPDGLFVNLAIIANGYARPLTIRPNDTHSVEFVAAARTARDGDIGLWHACAAPG